VQFDALATFGCSTLQATKTAAMKALLIVVLRLVDLRVVRDLGFGRQLGAAPLVRMSACQNSVLVSGDALPKCLGIKIDQEVCSRNSSVNSLAQALLIGFCMNTKTNQASVDSKRRSSGMVVVIGGNGGMSSLYRELVEKHGCELRHYEKRVPSAARRAAGKIALVVVMVGMVSHALLQQVHDLPIDGAPIVYLRTASVSALKAALAEKV